MTPVDLVPVRTGDGIWPWVMPGEGGARTWLERHGARPGGRIALAGLNTLATAQALLAALRLGCTVVLLNHRLAAVELAEQLAHATCPLVVADPAHPVAGITSCAALPPGFDGTGSGADPTGSLVLFTSGSTGSPKAARLETPALLAAVAAHVTALGLGPETTWACPLPLDHVGGAMCVLRAAASGCRGRVHPRFDPATLSTDLDGRIDGASVVPSMLHRVLELRAGRRFHPRLRRLLTGGGPLDPALAGACAALGLPPSQTYGLTEMGSMATVLDPADWAAHPGSAGRAVPGARLRIVDGRIEVGGAMRFTGYEDGGRLAEPAAEWHATGDLGGIDGDGFLTVHGRVAELIVSGGENVSAREVEAALEAHPAVAEAAACGLPDAEWGEIVAAAVVVRGEVGIAELEAFLATRLAGFKRPRRWRFVDALPRSGGGKLRRGGLRQLFS